MSYLFPTYARWEVEPETALGSYLIDRDGKKYLDFTSGIGVCNLGHQPQVVKEAVHNQLNRYWHVSNLFKVKEQEEAAELIANASGMDAVFFANSGAEANEAAIKLARKATGRTKILTFEKSFHGRTFATMSATGQEKIKQGFGPMLEKFVYLPFNDIDALRNEMDESVAAVMIEIVQGEGGINLGNMDFLKEVEQLCKAHHSLFIIDEIQTGIGRTGKPFAFQQHSLKPDIVTSAKGLGSGFPIGAVIGTKALTSYFGPGSHGSTFGGNPVSISAAVATMKTIFQDSFLREVDLKSKYLMKELTLALEGIGTVKEIRGMGLMIGIEMEMPVNHILSDLRDQGLLALPAGDQVLRLLPPLTVSMEEIDEAVNKLQSALKKASIKVHS